MLFIYLKNPLGVLTKYGLESIQDLIPTPTAAYFDCSVIYFPSDCCEISVSIDKKNLHGAVVRDGTSEFLVGWGCFA